MGANIRIITNSDVDKEKYSGKLARYQQEGSGSKRYTNYRESYYERDPYNEFQNFLYRRAMYGLSIYSEKEQKTMHWDKKKRIQVIHAKAQESLNIWKQEIVNHYTVNLFKKLFPGSAGESLSFITEDIGTDPAYHNDMSFKDLGITKELIIDRFIREKILPESFRTLKSPPKKHTKT